MFLAAELGQPLLVEGEAGVGKTEVAKALAAATGSRLIRLQCHEGIDVHHALYDWDYSRQLMAVRAAEGGVDEGELYSRRFLLRRPLLEALEADGPVVLLIDEIDRADDEFGPSCSSCSPTSRSRSPSWERSRHERPLVVLTSNRTRELHDALKRRCMYHWIDYPEPERETEIVRTRVPGAEEAVVERVVEAVARLRRAELYKLPGVGETIAWAQALGALGPDGTLDDTLGVALKVREDLDRVRTRESSMVPEVVALARAMRAGGARWGRARSRRRRAPWASWAPRARTPISGCARSCARAARTSRSSTRPSARSSLGPMAGPPRRPSRCRRASIWRCRASPTRGPSRRRGASPPTCARPRGATSSC